MAGESIRITGLRELQGAFKQVDSKLPGELRSKFLEIATTVASEARSRVPRLTGSASASIRPRASQRGAGIAFSDSGGSVPYFPWLNFGGSVGRGGSIKRDRVTPDNYVYTAISAHRDETAEAVEDAVEAVAERARFETREGF